MMPNHAFQPSTSNGFTFLRSRTICPICEGNETVAFLDRPNVAVHQNLLMADIDSAVAIARGQLSMRYCRMCGFIYNARFDPRLLRYNADYDNRQNCSDVFEDHLNRLVRHLIDACDVRNCRVVEVGCGEGSFLRKIVEDESAGNVGVGFDPAYIGPEKDLGGRLRFQRRFYEERAADAGADVIVCRHVIEHVPEPIELLRSMHAVLMRSPNPRVFLETPCVRWILENQVVWDFFYEHCSLFTLASLTTAFQRARFNIRRSKHVFGGQYLWLEAAPSQDPVRVATDAMDIAELASAFAGCESRQVAAWTEQLDQWSRLGRVALWGAGAKGVTFANLVDADRKWIDCIVDINPAKRGRRLPGSGHAIVGPGDLARRGVRVALLLNPNYQSEIEDLVKQCGHDIRVINLMNFDNVIDPKEAEPRRR